MLRTIGLALLLGYLPATALAQESTDPMEACSRQADANARLACFDHEMQQRHAATAQAKQAQQAQQAQPRTQPQASPPPVIAESAGKPAKAPPAKPIVATVDRVLPQGVNLYAFELDNGQLWEALEPNALLRVDAHDTVTIATGVLGGFFLTTQQHQRVRVRRLH